MRKQQGITLIELLVALAIFASVTGLVTVGISSALRVQGLNEASTTAQSKLRRVTEVFTQELRSAVLGGIVNTPYAPDEHTISFMLLDGSSGFPVLPTDSGNNKSFTQTDRINVVAPAAQHSTLGLEGAQGLMINALGNAVIFDITNVQQQGGASGVKYLVVHPHCNNTIDYTDNSTMLFNMQTLGYRFDDATGTLYQRIGSGDEVALAFGLSTFRLEYVYLADADGTVYRLAAPLTDATGAPLRDTSYHGKDVRLARINVVVGAEVPHNGTTTERTYSGQVEMPTDQTFEIKKVVPCA